jgi:hypothetical protein
MNGINMDLYISEYVLRECKKGDKDAAKTLPRNILNI